MKYPPVHSLHWSKAWRLVPTRVPRIDLYGRIAASPDQRALIDLEQLTNPRVQMEKGMSHPLRESDYFAGRVSSQVRATFAYLSKSRFGNGTFPMLYAASNEATALAEKTFHWAQFLKAHETPPTFEKHLALELRVAGDFHDLRGLHKPFDQVYSTRSYTASQALGLDLWQQGSKGIAYDSVRHPSGECIAVFSPQTINACARGPIYEFHWDGKTITGVFRLESPNK